MYRGVCRSERGPGAPEPGLILDISCLSLRLRLCTGCCAYEGFNSYNLYFPRIKRAFGLKMCAVKATLDQLQIVDLKHLLNGQRQVKIII